MEKISGSAAVHLRLTKLLAAASLIGVAAGAATAQDAGAAEDEVAELEEIVVTGFRQSLAAALDMKKNSTSAVDAIVAEDIAKFPDQNLAESLQRIPGISIQRDAGEGRAITVRGLSPQYTRVRLNGMETITTSTDGASANRDRSFDFNVFASELFNSIVVNKTAEASLDEGSLGAVIDLNTGNPLSFKEGPTFVASAKAQYNDLSEDLSPRVALLGGWVNEDKTFGVSASLAYSSYETLEMGNNSVRWQTGRFRSVEGVACPATGASAACNEVTAAFHPRIPRYGEVGHDRERLGATASIQFAPNDGTKVSIDGLYSKFDETRTEKWGEVLFRSNEATMDIRDYTIVGSNMVKATVDNAWVRIEDYRRDSSTEFHQLSGKWEQDVTESFRFELLGGFSQSDADIPLETTIVFDDRDHMGYSYDYTNMNTPVLTFGKGIRNPEAFQFAEFRDRPSFLTNKFRTLALDGEWDVNDNIQLVGGGMYRRFSFDTIGYRRDSLYCSAFTCAPGTYGAPVTDAIADQFTLGDAGQPAGNTNQWVVPDMEAAAELIDLYGREAVLQAGEDRGVVETVKGGFLQANLNGEMGEMTVSANAGMRYAHTRQSSTGFNNGAEVTVVRTYDDWLPSANVAIFPTPEFAIRAAAAKVITRPTLGDLTPGGSVDGFNFRVTSGNPFLTPFRSTNLDLAFEWYFADEALASVALFKKNIKSFPISQTVFGTYASTGLPESLIPPGSPGAINPTARDWEIRSKIDGEGANVKGVEFTVQTPFAFMGGIGENFGTILNLTLLDSTVDYDIGGTIYNETLFGLSKKAANGTLYYEDDKFAARVSVAYRGGYIDAVSATGNRFEGYGNSMNVDASLRYRLTDSLEVSLEGINLTDDYRDRYVDLYDKRNYEYNHFGRVVMLGVRYTM